MTNCIRSRPDGLRPRVGVLGTLVPCLVLGAALGQPASAAPQKNAPEQKALSDRDLSKVAEELGNYLRAKQENKGSYEVQEDLEKELGKAGKKLGGDGKSPDAMLAHPWSMARAVWLSADYDTKAGKKRKEPGKVTDQTGSAETQYSLWLPKQYKPKDGPYPVLLSIPEEGVDPEKHIMEEWVEGDIRDTYIIASPKMPGNGGEWLETSGGIGAVMYTLAAVAEDYAVDFDRIFVGGRGRGVETAQAIAARFPDRFAGVFGWAGDALADLPAENFRNIPVIFVGGGTNATKFQEAAKALKIETVTLQPVGKAMDIHKWATTVRRDPYPTEVSFVQKNGNPSNGYWIKIDRVDAERVAIDAKVDRATNTITIEGVGVDSATLYLNDALVDMDEVITVIANGEESKFSEGRKMSLSLELWMGGRNDGGRFFVATHAVRIPPRPVAPVEGEGDAGK